MTSTLKILIIDDNEPSAKTLGWMMELIGHDARLAFDGSAGIEAAKEYKPDVVLLDIGLPIINGYEACSIMRKDAMFSNTIFIAQTGWGQEEHRQRSKEAGFDFHLVKPIQLEQLRELLEPISQKMNRAAN